jgi:hypothetical protein
MTLIMAWAEGRVMMIILMTLIMAWAEGRVMMIILMTLIMDWAEGRIMMIILWFLQWLRRWPYYDNNFMVLTIVRAMAVL